MENSMKECNQNIKVLYVNDERFSREKLLRILERRFTNVHVATSGEEGYLLYTLNHPDIIIADINLDKMNSLEFIEKIRKQDDQVQIIVTTAYEDSELLLQLLENNINHFISKPIDLEKFIPALQKSVLYVQFEKNLEKQKDLNSFLLNFQDNLMFVIKNNQIVTGNRAFFDYTGLDVTQLPDLASLVKTFICESNYYFPKDQGNLLEEIFNEYNGMVKVKWEAGNGKTGIFLMKVTFIPDEELYLFVCTDITQLEVEYRKNELLISLDPITKIYNRFKFSDILMHEIEASAQINTPFSIILLDIDNFQQINDRFGYSLGDEILSTFATIIQQRIGENDVLARWGGKEFILLIPDSDLQAAIDMAESLKKIISNFLFHSVESITCSFGVAQYSPEKSKDQLLKEVDHALLISKLKGKNCVSVFQEQDNEIKAGVWGV